METRRATFTYLIGGLWLYLLFATFSLPDVRPLAYTAPVESAFMARAGGPYDYEWRPLTQIASTLQRAVVAAEDDRFYEHHGFDVAAIQRALRINLKRGKYAFGGSTITQQLAKNLYLSASKNPFRKLKELMIALQLENCLRKERILELYLNVVQWGPNIFGAEAAAQFYFQHDAKDLSAAQSAFLATILPNPVALGKRGFRLTPRALVILRTM